jgi:hypothetical protein
VTGAPVAPSHGRRHGRHVFVVRFGLATGERCGGRGSSQADPARALEQVSNGGPSSSAQRRMIAHGPELGGYLLKRPSSAVALMPGTRSSSIMAQPVTGDSSSCKSVPWSSVETCAGLIRRSATTVFRSWGAPLGAPPWVSLAFFTDGTRGRP